MLAFGPCYPDGLALRVSPLLCNKVHISAPLCLFLSPLNDVMSASRMSRPSIRRAPTGPRNLKNPHAPLHRQGYEVVHLSDEDLDRTDRPTPRMSASPPRYVHNYPTPATLSHSFSAASTIADLSGDVTYLKTSPTYGFDAKTPRTAVDPNAAEVPFLPKYETNDYWSGQPASPPSTSGGRWPFERPDWKRLACYVVICLFAWPFLLLVSLIANHKSIFWARFIVALGSGALGFGLALVLLEFAKRYLEAATWATVIHQSRGLTDEGIGILLRDLTRFTSERTSMYSAIWLLMDRLSLRSTSRKARRSYDQKPWSLFILFYLFIICFCSALPFIFGRILVINPITVQQNDIFDEVFVWGDLSDNDIKASSTLGKLFAQSVQWTLAPFASLTNFPPSVSLFFKNDTVYFAESYANQLRSDGQGLGTFDLNVTTTATRPSALKELDSDERSDALPSLVQFPKWGIRIHCEPLPDPTSYLVPMSLDGFTYIFVPDSLVKGLFANLSLPAPTLPPANLSSVLSANDTLPAGTNASSIVMAGKFFNNGVGHSFFSKPTDNGVSGKGWVQIEVVLIRMNNTFTPNGSFPLFGDADPVTGSRIGFDSVVCVESYEPYVVESFNSTGVSPSTTRIVSKGGVIEDSNFSPAGAKRRNRLSGDLVNIVQRQVNSTGKMDAFSIAHENSIDQMVKDNGRDMWYVPSPLAVSFTDGAGPQGYTKLSPEHYAQARAMADATNVLPFLAGTGAVAARLYTSRIISTATVDIVPMIISNIVILVIGLIAGLCVPKLPLAVPRRGFDLMSWLAVLYGDNVIGQLPILPGSRAGLNQRIAVEDVDRKLGDIRVKYAA